ncbi:MAG: winged helix-turn-helix domain-containing protein [Eggerthellaceae bacterium]|jgi:DNA-binding response OmpR family regulator
MQRKQVLFAADGLDDAHLFRDILGSLDVEVVAGAASQLERLIADYPDVSLVIFDSPTMVRSLAEVEHVLSRSDGAALLAVVSTEDLANLRLPVQVRSDFVVRGASAQECTARIRQLLWPGKEAEAGDFITVDDMTIDLATYQVTVNDEPVDFTYLEYSLLSFLVTHPDRTYSRDALLRRVWGFDYYGGSRTVDVHVRRIRAKLGPDLSQHLETVRGVGYLWAS